jgi:cobalt-zinc-cadmium efflux system outer membrane protein
MPPRTEVDPLWVGRPDRETVVVPDTDEIQQILQRGSLTLHDAQRVAGSRNPRLIELHSDIDARFLAAYDATLLPNPSLLLEVEEYPLDEGGGFGDSQRGFGVGQAIPIGGRLGAAETVANTKRRVATVRYVLEHRRVMFEVKAAFWAVIASNREVELARETRDIAKELHDLTEHRFKAHAVPEMELLKAAVNLAMTEQALRTAEAEQAVTLPRLRTLLGDVNLPVDELLGVLSSSFQVPSMVELRQGVVDEHPAIVLARSKEKLAETEVALARAERTPDVRLDLLLKWNPDDDKILEGGLAIPIPVFNHNQGRIAAAEIRVRQAGQRRHHATNEVLLSLEDAFTEFSSAHARVRRYESTVLPKAQEALKQTEQGYKAGKFTFLDVLDAQKTLAGARATALAALLELNLAVARLELITGAVFESS